MSEIKPNREEILEDIKMRTEAAQKAPISIDDHHKLIVEQASREQGYVKLDSSDDLRDALQFCKKTAFPLITDEWIDKQVEHEVEHVEAGKQIYGEDASYSFGIQFLKTPDGRPAMVAMYTIAPNIQVNEDTFLANSRTIMSAPKYHSENDNKYLATTPQKSSDKLQGN